MKEWYCGRFLWRKEKYFKQNIPKIRPIGIGKADCMMRVLLAYKPMNFPLITINVRVKRINMIEICFS